MSEITYPQIYYEIAVKYPCTAEDLFRAAPFKPDVVIEKAGQLFACGYLWWQVKRMIS